MIIKRRNEEENKIWRKKPELKKYWADDKSNLFADEEREKKIKWYLVE
jgi:hypothetical protein